jgi:hypothetical protein
MAKQFCFEFLFVCYLSKMEAACWIIAPAADSSTLCLELSLADMTSPGNINIALSNHFSGRPNAEA